jgi:Restriction endonuclease
MPKQGLRITLDRVFLAIIALFVLGGFMALGFLQKLSEENRALLIIIISTAIIGSLACMMLATVFRRRLRKWTWQRAMASWKRNSRAAIYPKFLLPDTLVENELRQLAIQVFCRMGYRIASRPDEAPYLILINPDGRTELVACNQQLEPIELHHIYSLDLEMKRTKADYGFFWAPAGFSNEAVGWVKHRSITLADRLEIGRLVDCAQTKGSRLLDYSD